MEMLMMLLMYLNLLEVMEVSSQTVTINPVGDVRVDPYESILFTASYSGPGSVGVVTWIRNDVDTGVLRVQADGSCTIFAGSIDASLYQYSCGSDQYSWKILNVSESEDEEKWKFSVNTGSVTPNSPEAIISVQVCPKISDDITVNTTDRSPNTVVFARCGNEHNSIVTTCQVDGDWNPKLQLNCGPRCCCICCFIPLIVNVVLIVLLVSIHIWLTWTNNEYSIKKIRYRNKKTTNNETKTDEAKTDEAKTDEIKTDEAVCLKDYGKKAVLPGCCICVMVIIIQLAVYFGALEQKDCDESCDECCGIVICLVVPIIVSIVKDLIGLVIIYIFVCVKGCNYIDQGGNVDKGDSACCRRNNSILPICAGDDQQPSDRPRDEDDRYQSDEPKSNTTKKRKVKRRIRDLKTDEAGSFVSGKDIKVDTGGSASWRAQPPLPDIRSEKKNTRGLSANIDDSDINPSYEKKRLTPIGQESQPGWEEKTDRSEDGKEKKKKRKSKDKERDSNVTESADL